MAQAFHDASGRTWQVAVNIWTVKQARALLGLDIPALMGDRCKGLGELVADEVRLVDLLYVLCRDQAEAAGVSDREFGEAMLGPSIIEGRDAFVEALACFFTDPRQGEALRKLSQTARAAEEKMLAELERRTKAINPVSMGKDLAARLIRKSGTAPESSGSSRGR